MLLTYQICEGDTAGAPVTFLSIVSVLLSYSSFSEAEAIIRRMGSLLTHTSLA